MSTSTSRVILFLTVILAACIYLTSAAPIVHNELTAQLELADVSVPHINVFKKHQDDEEIEDEESDEDYEESTTTTTTATATATTSTKSSKYTKTTTTEEPTTTTTKSSKSTKTTTSDEPTATAESSKKGSSSSGTHSGDATYYGTGLGSCGEVSKDSDMIVALNHGQMANGANPNHNKLCGQTITAHGPKGSVTVKIVDTCPGCANGDLDLSPAAFSKIADMEKGRVPITWSFN